MSNIVTLSKKHRTHRQRLARRLQLESLEERRVLAFDLLAEYGTGNNPTNLLLAPIDAGSQLDLVIISAGVINIRLGSADGTFGPAISAGSGYTSVAAGDLTGDGKADLVTIRNESVTLLPGNGDGTFQTPKTIVLPGQFSADYTGAGPLPQSPRHLAVGDLDADGKLDLVVTGGTFFQVQTACGDYGCYYNSYFDDFANVLLGQGGGNFDPADVYTLGRSRAPAAVAIGDLNSDGDLDVITSNASGLSVLIGDGTGSVATPLHSGTGSPLAWIALGDFDGDGIVDTVTKYGASLLIQKGQGDGTFIPGPAVPMSLAVQSAVAGDVNADGTLDLVSVGSIYSCTEQGWYQCYASETTRWATVVLGTGEGRFTEPLYSALGSEVNNYYFGYFSDAALGDLTDDGLPELVALDYYDNVAVVAEGQWLPAGAPFINIGNETVAEGDSGTRQVTLTVSLSKAYTQTVTADFHTADGTADAASDYVGQSGLLVFAPGQTSQKITLVINGDRVAEYDEFFSVTLTNITNANLGDIQALVYITENEPQISIDHAYYTDPLTVVEGDVGTTPAVFTVTLSQPYTQEVTVHYYTSTGYTSDILAAEGTLRFAPGQTSQLVTVQVVNDLLNEDLKGFSVILDNPSPNTTITNAEGYCYIEDNDPLPTLSINDVAKNEGTSGITKFVFTLQLSAPSGQGVVVDYATVNGTARTSNNDYVARSGTVYIAAGQSSTTISVDVKGDKVKEVNETFFVNLSNAGGATIVDSLGQGTIINDDGKLATSIRINDAAVVEGTTSDTAMTFKVTLSVASEMPVQLNFATQNGTAKTTDNDYVATQGVLQFAPGETSKTIAVVIKGDKKREKDEYFSLILTDALYASIADSVGRGVIHDNGAY